MVDDDELTTRSLGPVSPETFEAFYAERFEPLSRFAFLLTGSPERADELAQDACEQVFRRWNDVDHPRTYARMAVLNGSRSSGRRLRVAERTPGDTRPPVELDTDALAVRSVIADLPERDREVIVLRYYLDLPVAEIADHLAIPIGTVKSLIHRAKNRLRTAFTEETLR